MIQNMRIPSVRDYRLVVNPARIDLDCLKDTCRILLQAVWSHLLPASFRAIPAGLRAPRPTPHARYPDSGSSLNRYATLFRRRIGRARSWKLLRKEHAPIMAAVDRRNINNTPASQGRQEPQSMNWGFCRLGECP